MKSLVERTDTESMMDELIMRAAVMTFISLSPSIFSPLIQQLAKTKVVTGLLLFCRYIAALSQRAQDSDEIHEASTYFRRSNRPISELVRRKEANR
ncbi:hypothetical protein SUGI_0069200 [Cryptomeria japonica]|nr:hypothetical protein SUGI_0069200 [Cryptomeria japonica]